MIAQRFVFTMDFLIERNTDCISESRKLIVESKVKRGFVILVRKVGLAEEQVSV